jgi:hypothetical protein
MVFRSWWQVVKPQPCFTVIDHPLFQISARTPSSTGLADVVNPIAAAHCLLASTVASILNDYCRPEYVHNHLVIVFNHLVIVFNGNRRFRP